MNSEINLIHLIADNDVACKLIAAWPICCNEAIDVWISTAITNYRRHLNDDYNRTAKMLLKTEICKKDGTIDSYVEKYLGVRAMKMLETKKRGRP